MIVKRALVCPCGVRMQVQPYKIGRKKYCSKPCFYKFRRRTSGLSYTLHKENPTSFKKGCTPWQKGTRGLLVAWNKGIKGSVKPNKGSFKVGQRAGDKHPNWKGGITPINQVIRHSEEYKAWRVAVFERDRYECQKCGQVGGTLNADHIKPFSMFPELRMVLDNGRTLCKECHMQTDSWGYKLKQNEHKYA